MEKGGELPKNREEEIPLKIFSDYRTSIVRPRPLTIKDEIWIYADYQTPDDVIKELQSAKGQLSEAVCDNRNSEWDKYKGLSVVGWRPMTELEIEIMNIKLPEYRENQRQAKLTQEQREREQYEQLKKKYE